MEIEGLSLITCYKNPIEVWNVDTEEKIKEIEIAKATYMYYGCFPDVDTFLIACKGGNGSFVVKFNYSKNTEIGRTNSLSRSNIWYVLQPQCRDLIITSCWDGRVGIHKYSDLSSVTEYKHGEKDCQLHESEYVEMREEIFTCGSDRNVKVFSLEKNKVVSEKSVDDNVFRTKTIPERNMTLLLEEQHLKMFDSNNFMKEMGSSVVKLKASFGSYGGFYTFRMHPGGNLVSLSGYKIFQVNDLRKPGECIFDESAHSSLGEVWRQQLIGNRSILLGVNRGVQVRDWNGKLKREWKHEGLFSNCFAYQGESKNNFGAIKKLIREDLMERKNYLMEIFDDSWTINILIDGQSICTFGILLL